jgi:hypothetical protein
MLAPYRLGGGIWLSSSFDATSVFVTLMSDLVSVVVMSSFESGRQFMSPHDMTGGNGINRLPESDVMSSFIVRASPLSSEVAYCMFAS